MRAKEHLPMYGVGPIYVAVIMVLTAAGVALARLGILPGGTPAGVKTPFFILGLLCAAFGVFLWVQGAIVSKLDKHIAANQLVTTGVYAWVRNPIYSAFLFLCTGALLMASNLWLLLLLPLYWTFLTVLMKHTEEKWLLSLYGAEYSAYCKRTNRCIPWFPKHD